MAYRVKVTSLVDFRFRRHLCVGVTVICHCLSRHDFVLEMVVVDKFHLPHWEKERQRYGGKKPNDDKSFG